MTEEVAYENERNPKVKRSYENMPSTSLRCPQSHKNRPEIHIQKEKNTNFG